MKVRWDILRYPMTAAERTVSWFYNGTPRPWLPRTTQWSWLS
jgi:hypothetical protein